MTDRVSSLKSSNSVSVLALGPQNVYPPIDGGKESIYGALAALASHAKVTYAYPVGSDKQIDGYAKIGVTALPLPVWPEERWLAIVSATLRAKPYKFEKYGSAAAVRALDAVMPAVAIDAIVCHHAHTFGLARRFAHLRGLKAPIVVREHNIEYELVESYRNSLEGVKRVAASLFAWLTRREELKIWRHAHAVAFLSDHDLCGAQRSSPSGNLMLIRDGIPLPPRRHVQMPGNHSPLIILFNPRAIQNISNLRQFIDSWWIPLRNAGKIGTEKLAITGVTTEQLSSIINKPALQLHHYSIQGLGFMPSLATVFQNSLAMVSPTFVGGGIRKKILEAMANQLPVIATKLDIDSCDFFQRDVNILQLNDPNGFAESVCRLRENDFKWRALSENARKTVEINANWDSYGRSMIKTIKQLMAARRNAD
jgi:glycosyltransferase involved in cell wall biosynthesis